MPRYCSHCGLPLGLKGEHPGSETGVAVLAPPKNTAAPKDAVGSLPTDALPPKLPAGPIAGSPGLGSAPSGGVAPPALGAAASGVTIPKSAPLGSTAPAAAVPALPPTAGPANSTPTLPSASPPSAASNAVGAAAMATPPTAPSVPISAPPSPTSRLADRRAQRLARRGGGEAIPAPLPPTPAAAPGLVATPVAHAPASGPPRPTLDKPPPASPDVAYYERVLKASGKDVAEGETCLLAIDKSAPPAGNKAAAQAATREYSGHFALLRRKKGKLEALVQSPGAAHPGALTEDALWLLPGKYAYKAASEEWTPADGEALDAVDADGQVRKVVASQRKPQRSLTVIAGRRGRPCNDSCMSAPPQLFRRMVQALEKDAGRPFFVIVATHA